jgi:hypothetical protein
MPELLKEELHDIREELYGGLGPLTPVEDEDDERGKFPHGWYPHPKEGKEDYYLMTPLRKGFIVLPGHVLIRVDYSQIELRLMAHISGDKKLMDAYTRWNCECGASGRTDIAMHFCPECGAPDGARDKLHPEQPVKFGFCLGLDIHSLTALTTGLMKKYGEKRGRQMAKIVNFGQVGRNQISSIAGNLSRRDMAISSLAA